MGNDEVGLPIAGPVIAVEGLPVNAVKDGIVVL
jgi:hypothetical protein